MLSFAGSIDISILLMAGTHCRLENSSETGGWLQSETFAVADVVFSRKAPDKVGSVMTS